MNPVVLVLLLSFLPAVEEGDVEVGFTIHPEEPWSFQPFSENQPARVRISVRDPAGELIRNVRVSFSIEHVRGRDFLNTGFPYLEGKKVLEGGFIAPEGELEFNYVFPVRGNYRVSIEASPTEDSAQFTPVTREFRVHVREQGYQIRNAFLLSALLLFLGVAIGVVYGRAYLAGGRE